MLLRHLTLVCVSRAVGALGYMLAFNAAGQAQVQAPVQAQAQVQEQEPVQAQSVQPTVTPALVATLTPTLNLSRPRDSWSFLVSPGATYHYSRSEEHRTVNLVALERRRENGNVHGAAFFTNSFGQPTGYWYPYGQHYANVFGINGFYAKYTLGILYGYVGKYADKVPLNYGGFSPAIVPAIGYQPNKNYAVQLNVLGNAGLMLSFSSLLDF